VSRLKTRGALNPEATRDIAAAMNAILADVFALYIKTKNFHWHMSGPHFHDYTILLNEQAIQILAMSDLIAERIRKLGGSTIRSIGQIARHQRILDNDAELVAPLAMLSELREDNEELSAHLREAHHLCNVHNDIGTAGLIQGWVDATERRMWILFESGCKGDVSRR
jgi:starvation-inducible DNA-binding protein